MSGSPSTAHGDLGVREWALHAVTEDRGIRMALGILAFVLATSFGAHVAMPLPWTPVPMTLQPLFVILAGALLGPWGGAGAMASYLAVGAAGAPVFSGGNAGLAWLMGPTGGYLAAYPASAFLVGALLGDLRETGAVRAFFALAAGVAVMYVGGVSQLWILMGGEGAELLRLGVLPFVAGDLLKVAAALLIVMGARRVRREEGVEGPGI